MECFTIMSNEIEGRIDPFYYRPEFREFERKLNKLKVRQIKEIAKVICGPFGSSITVKDYTHEGVPLIRISNIEEDHLSKKNIAKIPEELAKKLKSYIVKGGDLIISQRGTLGVAVKVTKNFDNSIISANFIAIKNINGVLPDFLQILLSSKFGQIQLIRKTSGQVQTKITTDDIKTIKIPILPLETQQKIISKIKQAYNLKKQKETEAQQLLDSINDYVLSELGIKLPELKDKMTFVVYAGDIKGKRIDAYYYQPKFEEIEKAIEKGKFKLVKIKDILEINNKLENIKKYEQIQYIDLASIDKDLGIIKEYKIINSSDAPSRARQKVNKGDLLLASLSGSLKSIAIVNKDDNNIIASTGFYIIKNTDNYNNYYLWALFRNKIYQILLNRETTGAIMPAISRDSLLNLKIPIPPLKIQNKIAEEVKRRMQKAEQLQKEAKEILEKAKQEVEKMILEG